MIEIADYAVDSTAHYNQLEYRRQLLLKEQYLRRSLAPFYQGSLQVFCSTIKNYRMRSEFRVWHEGENCSYAMFTKGQKPSPSSVIRLTSYPAASVAINRLMPQLMELIRHNRELKQRLFQVDFLSTTTNEVLLTMAYHRQLDDNWQLQASLLAKKLQISIVGRSRKQKLIIGNDYVTEKMNLSINAKSHQFSYRQPAAAFTQPNAVVCRQMLNWAVAQTASIGGDLLELYCGNGNFSLPMAMVYKNVLATEMSKVAIAAARYNALDNGLKNLQVVRLKAEEFAAAYFAKREFFRLKSQGINLQNYNFSTVLVDPPRAGIDEAGLVFLSEFEYILYISCNVNTLCANLAKLNSSHSVISAAMFDQFPYTKHIEAAVMLRKR